MMKGLRLTKKDYEIVLNYYKLPYKKNDKAKNIKEKAEKVLSDKLCKCIKKVSGKRRTKNENAAIPICKNAVLITKGLTDRGFKCKKTRSIKLKRSTKNYQKTRRTRK